MVAVGAAPAAAHPLGNFTVNTAAALVVGTEATRIDYVLDLAEIPALQTRQEIDGGDGEVSDAEALAYGVAECAEIAGGVRLEAGGRDADVTVTGVDVTFPPGEAGLATLRLECTLAAATGPLGEEATLHYTDASRSDRIGWREVTAVGDGMTVTASDVPDTSPSDRLRGYPEELLQSPLRQTTAALAVVAGGPAAADAPVTPVAPEPSGIFDRVAGLATAFTDLVGRQDLTVGFGFLAVGLAVLLGTLHALAPGHGKTVMAAYLVAREGAAREAILLGLTVAVTHTLGVLLLGAVLTAGQVVAPQRLYPLLGAISGVLFAVIGLTLLVPAVRRWRRGETGHSHGPGADHGHDHGHDHSHGLQHDHDQGDRPDRGRSSGRRALIAPGLAGGLSPSPSALVVLLGGIALGRAWFGVALVIAYGVGMAAALVATGWLLVRLRGALAARSRAPGAWATRLGALLPVVTASLIVLGGLVVAFRSAVTL